MKAPTRRRLLWSLALILLIVAATALLLLPAPGQGGRGQALSLYEGARSCEECHAEEAERWRGSHHAGSMQQANANTVVGDFDARFTDRGATTRFSRAGGGFRVRTAGPDGKVAEYPVAYTLGVFPLQQYLLALPGGRYQALGIAWDARPAAEGGQRWVPLDTPAAADHRSPMHWTRASRNWNSECAECHSTNLRKGYRVRDDRFITAYSEMNVACEACHGPGSRHVEWARAARARGRTPGADPGLIVGFGERRQRTWEIDPTSGNARPQPVDPKLEVATCARCHSTRVQLSEEYMPGRPLGQTHRPAFLEQGLYFADGQPRDDIYTWGSFVQGRMFAAGVTCSDCHDAHDLQLRAPADALCSGCHAPERYASRSHHFHREDGAGASCVACHMRADTILVVDRRHDHTFRVPRPDLTEALGPEQAPNTCNDCHRDRTPRWAAQAVHRWYPQGRGEQAHYGQALHEGRALAPGAEPLLVGLVRDTKQPGIVRATALKLLSRQPGAGWFALLQKASTDTDALVRMAVASALETLPVGERVRAAVTLLWDPVLAVRVSAVPAFAEVPDSALASEQHAAFDRSLDDYYRAQRANAERPEAHVRLGLLHARRGRLEEARRDYEAALRLGSGYAPAYVGLADLLRASGQHEEAETVLRRALKAAPPDPAVHLALSRLLARHKRPADALRHLQRASELAPDDPAIAHEHARALKAAGRAEEAVAVLRAAQKRTPGSRELLLALASETRDGGRLREAREWARLLVEAAPGDPAAQALASELDAGPLRRPEPAAGAGRRPGTR